jgi:hypothetical protein
MFFEPPLYSNWLSQIKSGVLNPDDIKNHKEEFPDEAD